MGSRKERLQKMFESGGIVFLDEVAVQVHEFEKGLYRQAIDDLLWHVNETDEKEEIASSKIREQALVIEGLMQALQREQENVKKAREDWERDKPAIRSLQVELEAQKQAIGQLSEEKAELENQLSQARDETAMVGRLYSEAEDQRVDYWTEVQRLRKENDELLNKTEHGEYCRRAGAEYRDLVRDIREQIIMIMDKKELSKAVLRELQEIKIKLSRNVQAEVDSAMQKEAGDEITPEEREDLLRAPGRGASIE